MWQGLSAHGQQPATCCSSSARNAQVTRGAALGPQQSRLLQTTRGLQGCNHTATKCDKQGYHESLSLWPTQLHQQSRAAAAPGGQHTPQQPFIASSGMHSTLLHVQQQQVTQQLLQAQTQARSFQYPGQQQNSSSFKHTSQHISQHDAEHSCVSQAAAATAIQQRCQGSQHHNGHGCDDVCQQQELDVVMYTQQQLASGNQQQQDRHNQQQQQQQLGHQEGRQRRQQQQPDRQQRLLAVQHPAQITGWIRHSSTVQELQELHQLHGPRFNPINMSAMLVKLARIAGGEGSKDTAPAPAGGDGSGAAPGAAKAAAGSSSSSSEAVQALALRLAHQLLRRLSECDSARQAANASWALAVLQCAVPHGLLQQAAQQLVANEGRLLAASQPQELATLAWGLAKLQHDPCCAVWPLLVAAAHQELDRFKPQELAMLMWALAHLQQRQQQHWRAGVVAGQQCAGGSSSSGSAAGSAPQQGQQQQAHDQQLLQLQQQERQGSNATASTSAPVAAGGVRTAQGSNWARSLVAKPSSPAAAGPVSVVGGDAAGRQARSQDTNRPRHAGSSSRSSSPSSSSSSSKATSSSSNSSSSIRQQGGPLQQCLQILLPTVCDCLSRQLQEQGPQQQYKPQELSMLLWSFAVLGYRDVQLLNQMGDQLQQAALQGRCNAQDMSNSLWALGKLQVEHPKLLAAAADSPSSWLAACSMHELSMVLYGCSAATAWQLPASVAAARDASDLARQSVAQLWEQAVDEVQCRLAAGAALGCAEAATLLQAAALALQPVSRVRSRQRQQQQQRRMANATAAQNQQNQQQQGQQQQHNQSQHQGGGQQEHGQQGSAAASAFSSSSSMSTMSMMSLSSMTGSWDGDDWGVTDAARTLVAAVDAHLVSQPGLVPAGSRYTPCMLSALAAAQVRPSTQLMALLLAAAQAAAPAMNRQQLCMTAWAAAKLSTGGAADERVSALMDAVEQSAISKLPTMQPQQLSVLAWAHARLWNLGDSLLMHELASAAMKQLPRFGPQALSNLTWAFARARHYDGLLAAALARRAKALVGQFSPAELANLAWGLVTLRSRQLGLLAAVAAHTTQHCSSSSWDAKALTKLAATFSSDGMPAHRFKGMFFALGDALVGKPGAVGRLTAHELSQLAVAFAVARVRHKGLAGHIAVAAVQQLERMALLDAVQLVWALACLNHRHDPLLDAVSARVAAEMGGVQHMAAAADTTTGNGSSDERGTSAVNRQDSSVGSSSSSSRYPSSSWSAGYGGSSSSSSMFSGKLRQQYLPRLAWAYETLQHEDACWYLAAAHHAASLQQQESRGSSSSNGTSASLVRSSLRVVSGGGGALHSSTNSQPGRVQTHNGAGMYLHNDISSSKAMLPHVARVASGAGSRIGSSSSSSSSNSSTGLPAASPSKVSSVFPVMLQRPLYQQPVQQQQQQQAGLESATSGLVRIQQQQQQLEAW